MNCTKQSWTNLLSHPTSKKTIKQTKKSIIYDRLSFAANPSWRWASPVSAGIGSSQFGQEVGYTVCRSWQCRHIETNNHHTYQQPVNLHVSGLWEEDGTPGENPCIHKENMQTSNFPTLHQLHHRSTLHPVICKIATLSTILAIHRLYW